MSANRDATTLVDARMCVHRTIGETRRRLARHYDDLVADAATCYGIAYDALCAEVEAAMPEADRTYYVELCRRGRPADAQPTRATWIAEIGDYLLEAGE